MNKKSDNISSDMQNTWSELIKIQNVIKTNANLKKKYYFSNMYINEDNNCGKYRIFSSDYSVVGIYKDYNGLMRGIFGSYNLSDLSDILKSVPQNVIVDYICKDENKVDATIIGAGFSRIAIYARKSSYLKKDGYQFRRSHSEMLAPYYDPELGEFATEDDASEIYSIWSSVFSFDTDHIPSEQFVRNMIKKHWILVYRHDNKIGALYAFQIQGKKFYSNLSYNELPAIVLYCLERRAHEYVINNYDVVEKYSWINMSNERSLRRNILDFDGVQNYIYKKI